MKRGAASGLALALLGAAGAGAWLILRPGPRIGQSPPPAPGKAGPSGPPVPVGVATGYAPAELYSTGPIDYSHMPAGWASWEGNRVDDWSRWGRA